MWNNDIHIGIKILLHNKGRLILSILGIAFSVLIMFLQLGFFNGVNDSQARITQIINADLIVLSKKRHNLNKWNRMPRTMLSNLAAMEGIKEVIPIYKNGMNMRNNETNTLKRIIVYSFPPNANVFNISGFDEISQRLKVPGSLLYDKNSRDIYGSMHIGEKIQLGDQPYTIVGYTNIGPNLINDGAVFISEGSLFSHRNGYDQPVMILLRLHKGTSVQDIQEKINNHPTFQLNAYTAQELNNREIAYTIKAAPVGAIFGIGLIVGIIIGTIICYQILFNEITDHVTQYGTLKAMGYTDGFLKLIILEEASVLAVLGFSLGLLTSIFMYRSLQDSTALLMSLTTERVLIIFVLTLLMCLGAGLLALKKVLGADPADLY